MIGIDEVGRGALAGPVTVAAVLIPLGFRLPAGMIVRDSKKHTARGREKRATFAREHPQIRYAVARVTPRVIDRINISRAANRAAERAVNRLIKNGLGAEKNHSIVLENVRMILDGGIQVKWRGMLVKGTPRADEKFLSVALASIVAKVARDKCMRRLAKRRPEYGFERHVGYGTAAHRKAIRRWGLAPEHRRVFCKKFKV